MKKYFFLLLLLLNIISVFVQAATSEVVLKNGYEAGERKVLTIDGIDYAFRWCPPGEFMMGKPGSNKTEPVHKVKLTKGFWLLETEVTQAMWQNVTGEEFWRKSRYGCDLNGVGPNFPVYYVDWNACQTFCQKLSQKLEQTVQLPTEAQWEYACQAETTHFSMYEVAWFDKNSHDSTHEVGLKEPNSWGLYDMHGNVEEWCYDWYDKNYYSNSPVNDPTGPQSGKKRVLRGGGWYSWAWECISGCRRPCKPDIKKAGAGFRILIVPQASN